MNTFWNDALSYNSMCAQFYFLLLTAYALADVNGLEVLFLTDEYSFEYVFITL